LLNLSNPNISLRASYGGALEARETAEAPMMNALERTIDVGGSSYRRNKHEYASQNQNSKRNSIMLKPFSKNYLAIALEHNQKVKDRKTAQVATADVMARVPKTAAGETSPMKLNAIRT